MACGKVSLEEASKKGGCSVISSWMKGVRRHLYWYATSTKGGFSSLIIAKCKSFVRHVANVHSDHPDELYAECNHGNLEERMWIKRGKVARLKLYWNKNNKANAVLVSV